MVSASFSASNNLFCCFCVSARKLQFSIARPAWFDNVLNTIKYSALVEPSDVTLYYHNKEVDRTTFTYKGNEYVNKFYTDIFKENGFNMKQIEFVDRADFKIDSNARDIRSDIEGFKHFLDARIYRILKSKNW